MTTTFTAKVAADAGNLVSFGSDGGIYTPPSTVARNGYQSNTLDTSITPSGLAAWYGFPQYTYQNLTGTLGYVQPVVFTRTGRITGCLMSIASNSGGSGTVANWYHTLYLPDASGYPSTKVVDLARHDIAANATGISTAQMLGSSTVLTGHQLYYLLSWCYVGSVNPGMSGRLAYYALRQPTIPQSIGAFNGGQHCYTDSSRTWTSTTASPATLALTGTIATTAIAPNVWLQYVNS